MMKVFTYVCIDPACPPELRFVSHCFEPAIVKTGPAKGTARLAMLPAVETGAEPIGCGERLTAFLNAEIDRERRRIENAKAMGERRRKVAT